ncbi:hypothetical protein BN1708_020482, partial [Verticillium longisporum]
HRRRGRL